MYYAVLHGQTDPYALKDENEGGGYAECHGEHHKPALLAVSTHRYNSGMRPPFGKPEGRNSGIACALNPEIPSNSACSNFVTATAASGIYNTWISRHAAILHRNLFDRSAIVVS